jgi:tetratricopeptide (TPR) repeat protein
MSSLGQKIRNLRKERKMTQWELAEGLVTASMISQIESDKATPSPELLKQLAERLGVKPSFFADDMSHKNDLMQTYRRAKQLLEGENYAAALPLFRSLTNPVPPQFRAESIFSDLAQCHESLGQYDDAARAYEEVVRCSLEKNDVAGAVHAYYRLGQMERRLNRLDLARMYWQRAAELLRRHPELSMPLAMRIHMNLGRICLQLGDYALALDSYRRAAALADNNAAQLDVAMILHGMGVAHIELGNFAEAEQKLQEAIRIYDAIRHQRGVNQCYINIGVSLRKSDRYPEAIDHFTWCINHHEIQVDVIRLANALSERACCYLALGQVDEAIRDAKEAIVLDRDTAEIQAFARTTLARACALKEQYEQAVEYASQGIDYATRLGDTGLMAELYQLRAEARWRLGHEELTASDVLQLASLALSK